MKTASSIVPFSILNLSMLSTFTRHSFAFLRLVDIYRVSQKSVISVELSITGLERGLMIKVG